MINHVLLIVLIFCMIFFNLESFIVEKGIFRGGIVTNVCEPKKGPLRMKRQLQDPCIRILEKF